MKTKNENEPVQIFAGTTWQAEMVKSLLENVEIKAYLKDEFAGTLIPWQTAPGGTGSVKVFVSSQDYDNAKSIAEEYQKNLKEDN